MTALNCKLKMYAEVTDKEAWALNSFINRVQKNSGSEFLSDYFKRVKLFYIRLLSDTSVIPECPFVKKDKQGFPSGPLSFLRKQYEKGHWRVLISNLQIHTMFIAGKEPTKKQLDKFLSSVESDDIPSKTYTELWNKPYNPRLDPKDSLDAIKVPPISQKFEDIQWSEEKRALNPITLKSEPEGSLNQLHYLQSKPAQFLYGHLKNTPMNANMRLAMCAITAIPFQMWEKNKDIEFVGKISFLQEPGFKLRAVANPGRVFQVLLKPFGDVLFKYLSGIKNDYTYDQQAGVEVISKWISKGMMVYSIDLSDATNHFPLDYTCFVLRKIIDRNSHFWITMWKYISQAPWRLPNGKLVRWTKGQPLGLYPSFAAFSIAHHFMLDEVCTLCGVSPDDTYVMLGDDVCINNSQVANLYQFYLKEYHVPISLPKTIASSNLAEFAGSIVMRDLVINAGKWRIVSDDSFLDYLKKVGPRGLDHLRFKQYNVAKIVMSLPEPVGFGWNPEGLPLWERIAEYISLYYRKEVNVTSRGSRRTGEYVKWFIENRNMLQKVGFNIPDDSERRLKIISLLHRATARMAKDQTEFEFNFISSLQNVKWSLLTDKDLSAFISDLSPYMTEQELSSFGIFQKPKKRSSLLDLWMRRISNASIKK